MRIVFGILLMFTGAKSGSLFQDPAACQYDKNDQCYVAVGQQLHLPMPKAEKINLLLGDKYTFKYKVTQTSTISRWLFVTANKTLILTSAERSDSGKYTLEIFNNGGKLQSKSTFQVNVEATVSSVTLSYSCFFPKLRKVYCFADGDLLRFSWTSGLIGWLENNNKTLLLDKDHNEKVTCRVENHVSREDNSIDLQKCSDVTLPILCSVSGILILLSVLVFYFYKKNKGLKNKEAPSQDDEKVVYGDISHFTTNRTETRPRTSPSQDQAVEYEEVVHHKQKRNEDEVQYSELMFNTPEQKKNKLPKVQEQCMYAAVQHGH